MINIDYKDSRSLYEQIRNGLKELIINGIMEKDEKLPSVRELSVQLTVNPNTVQKAYKELENRGYIYSITGKGNYVSGGEPEKKDTEELFKKLFGILKELSYARADKQLIINAVNNIYEERSEIND